MATSKKNTTKVTPPEPPAGELPLHIDRKRQIRLGAGIGALLAGVFLSFSILSYYVNDSWKNDQDNFFAGSGFWAFLFHGPAVTNWGGRLGAVMAHILVFKGAGLASLAIGLAIGAVGLNLVYGKRASSLMRYIRWVSVALGLLAPTLTYLFPDSSFPLGGALGNVSIHYFNGLLGTAGTGMVLLSTILFFVFVIFALDLRPWLKRMQERTRKLAESLKPVPKFNTPADEEPVVANEVKKTAKKVAEPEAGEETDEDAEEAPFIYRHSGEVLAEPAHELTLHSDTPQPNKLKPGSSPLNIQNQDEEEDEEDEDLKEWKMDLVEKHLNRVEGNGPEEIEEPEEEPVVVFKDEYLDQEDEEEEEEEPEEEPEAAPAFSFEVKQQEARPTIKHGAHISIASNEPYAPELDLPDYRFPTLDLLANRTQQAISLNKEELERNKDQIIQTLSSFGIEIQHISATVGPTVTLYEIVPAKGVRISKIKNLEDDIALSLAALGIRIIAPIPGKGTIGIEVPNANKQIVFMQALLSSDQFVDNKMSLPIALGKRIDNENYIVDLATMPHLLMAGATGQGKSVGINAILVSLLYKKHPAQVKFVMVDPKKVELSIYRTIEKHFLAKLPNEEESIITDIKKVIYTLKALCDEMDDRYGLLKDAGARNIKEYNEKFIARRLNPENGHKYLPFIVLVVDEFADLIMTAGKEVEMPIARLAQLARAVGIHLIIATQRPSVNVITGTIKANFPARIAFKVSAKVDSRTILDTGGAEQLVGRGDMLISHGSELLRIQCAFVDTPEVENVVNFIGDQRGYPKAHPLPEPEMDDEDGGNKSFDAKNRDKLFEDCARTVVQTQSGSTSNLQRRFNLGYNRAGRIMDQLEAASIVGPAAGSKPREVYFKTESELEGFLDTLK